MAAAGRTASAGPAGGGQGGGRQMSLFAPGEELVAAVLRETDLDRLSPLEALTLLHDLKSRLR